VRSVRGAAFVFVVVGAFLATGSARDGNAPALVADRASEAPHTYVVKLVASDALIDLHHVRWSTAALPGPVCGLSHPIRLHGGKARVSPRLEVNAAWHPVAFGDLDGDGLDEAAVAVACSNGGGTADSVRAYAQVVFRPGTHSALAIGVLTPRWQPKHELPTLLSVVLRRDRVIGLEAFYGPSDGTCCPTGRARTVWAYRHRRLHLTTTRETKQPD
jgi:hypothetical protein